MARTFWAGNPYFSAIASCACVRGPPPESTGRQSGFRRRIARPRHEVRTTCGTELAFAKFLSISNGSAAALAASSILRALPGLSDSRPPGRSAKIFGSNAWEASVSFGNVPQFSCENPRTTSARWARRAPRPCRPPQGGFHSAPQSRQAQRAPSSSLWPGDRSNLLDRRSGRSCQVRRSEMAAATPGNLRTAVRSSATTRKRARAATSEWRLRSWTSSRAISTVYIWRAPVTFLNRPRRAVRAARQRQTFSSACLPRPLCRCSHRLRTGKDGQRALQLRRFASAQRYPCCGATRREKRQPRPQIPVCRSRIGGHQWKQRTPFAPDAAHWRRCLRRSSP